MNSNISIPAMLCIVLFGNSINASNNTTSPIDSCKNLIANTTEEYKIIKADNQNDTLRLVTTADYAFHPYGILKDSVQLTQHFGIGWQVKNAKLPDTSNHSKFFRVSKDSSNVFFFKDEESGKLEIVSGNIVDSTIRTTNGTHIGMCQKDMLSIYFSKVSKCIDRSFSVVIIESGLTGIWQYHYLRNGTIVRIQYRTDYDFQGLH
jgi:hypothetical protein